MSRVLPVALFVLVFAGLAGCSRGEAAPRSEPAATLPAPTADGRLPRLIFFMNPNGRPCQIQDKILDDMGAELKGKVEVVYYRTTAREDIAKFDQYGIRSLPALVLTDADGRELRRPTPGIQGTGAVRRLLGR